MTINAASVDAEIAAVRQRIAELEPLDARISVDDTEWIEALCAARKAQRLKQADIAKRMQTTQSAVSGIEKGTAIPRITTLARYAAAIGYRMVVRFEPLDEEGTAA